MEVIFEPDEIVELAQFCGELVRQGVTFRAKKRSNGLTSLWVVTFTGGF